MSSLSQFPFGAHLSTLSLSCHHSQTLTNLYIHTPPPDSGTPPPGSHRPATQGTDKNLSTNQQFFRLLNIVDLVLFCEATGCRMEQQRIGKPLDIFSHILVTYSLFFTSSLPLFFPSLSHTHAHIHAGT